MILRLRQMINKQTSFGMKIRRLILFTATPVIICFILLLVIVINTNRQYNNILENLSIAGSFNEDFQTTLNFKMYQVVINRDMFLELDPMDDIEYAQSIVNRLWETTTDAESLKRLSDINKYLEFLVNNINSIVENQGYEQNMQILDRRIRVLTSLVHEKMQEYIYNETRLMTDMRDSSNRNFTIYIIVFSSVSFIVITAVIVIGLRTVSTLTEPLSKLSGNFKTVGEGNFAVHPIPLTSTEITVLHEAFESMVSKIQELMEHIRQEKDNLRHIEFQLLQSQINPHFLYNTFDTIIWLTEDGEYEKVKNVMLSLSALCRVALSGGEDIITLREEIRHIQSYLEIQQVRYFDVLRYNISISDDLMDYVIPKLTLQPIVENALYHGIKNKRGGGMIDITCAGGDDFVSISIRDTGVGIPPEKLRDIRRFVKDADSDAGSIGDVSGTDSDAGNKSGYGLANVYSRLKLYYSERVTFEIDSAAGEYTEVRLTIPMEESD